LKSTSPPISSNAPTIEEHDIRVERVTIRGFEQLVLDGHINDAPTLAAYTLLRLHLDRA